MRSNGRTGDTGCPAQEDTGVEFDEAMRQFYASETFDKLMDPETGLYIEGSEYIYGIYRDELKEGSLEEVAL